MVKLEEIPIEVLLDNFLPLLPISDLLSLGSTNRFFTTLCNDNTFWKRKLQQDFNFSDEDTARSSGWKLIYRGLSHPHTYVWGEGSKGRLGLPRRSADVPYPAELHFPGGIRIVHLAAAGMGFFALDSHGNIYAWGTLNGQEYALQNDGYSAPGQPAHRPLKLALPAATRTISCGRLHATSLDEDLHIWTFLSFGRPFRLVTSLLDATTADSTPAQVESGWSFSSVLTRAGDVFVWWPFSVEMQERINSHNTAMDEMGSRVHATDGVIPCSGWELPKDPHKLPELPRLPMLVSGAKDLDVHLIKIAALDNHLVGLTNQGHVLKILVQNGGIAGREAWEYLPHFSESEKINEHMTSASSELQASQHIRITHISAQYHTFVAYSTGSNSVVLMGSNETNTDSEPRILPALQNINVISVVLGDYHFGALTSTGKLLTWGQYSRGALGLGDPLKLEAGQPGGFATQQQRQTAARHGINHPPAVMEPTEVRFDHEEKRSKKRFCFAATAAGWHMGALVIDLEHTGNSGDDSEEDSVPMPGGFPSESGPGPSTSIDTPGLWGPPRMPVFRVGYAGRGGTRGGFRGRGH
ncbi:regulator of chromosome condensation 1/beta-lactamase-inhibitor protein II [Melanogaster broomeanus]|nr:regulator of chromosome condensation 1/beta-lactamase-inhibitor protein II [Melanogaster broomeanus]